MKNITESENFKKMIQQTIEEILALYDDYHNETANDKIMTERLILSMRGLINKKGFLITLHWGKNERK